MIHTKSGVDTNIISPGLRDQSVLIGERTIYRSKRIDSGFGMTTFPLFSWIPSLLQRVHLARGTNTARNCNHHAPRYPTPSF
jgi:hypothetical protein